GLYRRRPDGLARVPGRPDARRLRLFGWRGASGAIRLVPRARGGTRLGRDAGAMSAPVSLAEPTLDRRELALPGNLRGRAPVNIPRAYSMAGVASSAMRLSVKWEGVWCRASS